MNQRRELTGAHTSLCLTSLNGGVGTKATGNNPSVATSMVIMTGRSWRIAPSTAESITV
jgi:hypothetical protein